MTVPVGGLRARLIRDSFYMWVRDGVADRGWMDTGRAHKPFEFIPEPVNWDEEIPLNSISVTPENVSDVEIELGSNLTDDTWTYYVDVYAENGQVGMDCSHDVRDLLRGKMSAITTRMGFPVWDLRMATPPVLFWCQIENVVLDRARDFPQAWRKFWFSVRCDLIDTYASDLDEGDDLTDPTYATFMVDDNPDDVDDFIEVTEDDPLPTHIVT